MYHNVRFNAIPTSYRTCRADLYFKCTLNVTILERRFVLVLHKMHINPLAAVEPTAEMARPVMRKIIIMPSSPPMSTLCNDLNNEIY